MTAASDHAFCIHIRDKTFPAVDGSAPLTLFQDFTLNARSGRVTALIGPSGCGKSTLLSLIAGVDRDFTGTVQWQGDGAPRIGFVFQTPRLLPWRTVAQNLALVMTAEDGPVEDRVTALLTAVGVGAFADSYPARLSLGMARRVGIARAFAVNPRLLLLDEPFVSLDQPTAARLRALTRRMLRTQQPVTALLVSHDPVEAAELADDLLLLSHPPTRLLTRLANPLSEAEREDPVRVNDFGAQLALMIGGGVDPGTTDSQAETGGDCP